VSKTMCVIVRQPPYGHLAAAEAVRHLAGAAAHGFSPVGLLVDDGVHLAKAGRRATAGWINLGAALADLLSETAARSDREAARATVAVHGPSMRLRGLDETDLAPGCRVVDDAEAAALAGQADATLVY
jgi:sulfur relay (sulfurtransferase) DsrF/TusC family protein